MSIMIDGVGIDLVELDDLKVRVNDQFVERILCSEELAYYQKVTHPVRKLTYLAGRFAAKEAYVKAYQSFDKTLNFKDVKVLMKDNGVPFIESSYRPSDTVKVSISHTDNYAVAIVMVSFGED